jgi:biopolymer transport protein ExbB
VDRNVLITAFTLGGWVMFPLLLLSVLSVAATIERIVFWARTHGSGRMRKVLALARRLRSGDQSGTRALAENDRTVYGQLTRLLIRAGAFEREGLTEAEAREVIEQVRGPVERASVLQTTIITAAPMLGILGTVTGIIRSFTVLGSQEGITDPSAVAGGIAEALYTTAFGLIVALVTLFPYVVFRAHVERAFNGMELLASAAVRRSGPGDDRP